MRAIDSGRLNADAGGFNFVHKFKDSVSRFPRAGSEMTAVPKCLKQAQFILHAEAEGKLNGRRADPASRRIDDPQKGSIIGRI